MSTATAIFAKRVEPQGLELPPGFCDGFTDDLRETLTLTCKETWRFEDYVVSTQHLLLGLLVQPASNAMMLLESWEISPENVRHLVERNYCHDHRVYEHFQLTPRGMRVLILAREVAESCDSRYVGTEHLLCALFREGEGLAAHVLAKLGVTDEKVADFRNAMRSGHDW